MCNDAAMHVGGGVTLAIDDIPSPNLSPPKNIISALTVSVKHPQPVCIIWINTRVFLLLSSVEAEHGYASVLPYTSDFSRKKTKASPMSRKTQNNR